MPYHQALIDAAEPHPLVKQLTRDIEDYHQKFVALSAALSENGNGHLIVLGGRDYENFVAALNNVRWDDDESQARRRALISPAAQAVTDAYVQMKATVEKIQHLPEHARETYRAKLQRCAVSIADREHAKIMARVAEVKEAIASSQP
jgi:hypothetical protein